MSADSALHNRHDHHYHFPHSSGEQRTRCVIALTGVMMVVEVTAGLITNSMALLADGWHMSTHVAALGLAAFAYGYARRHADDPRFTFGTGKVGTLGGFASAIFLAVVAVFMAVESAERLISPLAISFDEAILVAVIGLVVNLASVLLLKDDHSHSHHHDHNLKAAYIHVLADALTSLTAIVALLTGKYLGWIWMDPIMGMVGSLVIARWSYGLLRDTSKVLLDCEASGEAAAAVCRVIETEDRESRITDLHIWRLGGPHLCAIVSIATPRPRSVGHYKRLLGDIDDLTHVTVEVVEGSNLASQTLKGDTR